MKILRLRFIAIAALLFSILCLLFSTPGLNSAAGGNSSGSSSSLTLPSSSLAAKHIIMISLDGLDARYLHKRDEYGLKIPTLRRLMAEGATARGVVAVYPTVTYPNHTTMVTGAYPSTHGIFGNDLFEPPTERKGIGNWNASDIKAETLWNAAARKGMTSGMVSWPVSVGAGDFNAPEIWKPGGAQEETLAVIAENSRPQGLLKQIAERDAELYRHATKDEQDDMRTRMAEYIIREKRPNVMLIHLFDLDHFEHDYGPFTPEAFAMLEKVDGYVARLVAAAESAGTLKETAVFIVSDHGFKTISKQIHPGVLLERAGLVKLEKQVDASGRVRSNVIDWRAAVYPTGGSCAIMLRNPNDNDAQKRLRTAFNELISAKEGGSRNGESLVRIFGKDEVRKLRSNTKAALMLEASDGYSFGSNYWGDVVTDSRTRGTHGYLPTLPDYYASFIAAGAGVSRRGDLGVVRMIDIGPTAAALLGLKLKDAEGKALNLAK